MDIKLTFFGVDDATRVRIRLTPNYQPIKL